MGTLNLVASARMLGQWESGVDGFQIDLGGPQGGPSDVLTFSMFPYTVPAGCIYRVHGMDMTLKFPYDFNTHRTCYFQMYFGWVIAAHCPHMEFLCPFDLPAGFVINGAIQNGMQETQNMSVMVSGDLRAANEAELLTLGMPQFPPPMPIDAGGKTKSKKWWGKLFDF